MNVRRVVVRGFGVGVVVLLVVSGCGRENLRYAPGGSRLGGEGAVVPVLWQDGVLTVEVYLGSSGPFRFDVDTGAEMTMIDIGWGLDGG